MKIKTALLTGVSLLALSQPAHAFVAIGSAIISAFLSVGAAGLLPVASAATIGLATVGIAATALNVIGAAAFLGRRPSVDPQEIKNTTQGSEGPGRYAFGRVRLAGQIAFGNTAGYQIYRLLLNCFGPIVAVEEYYYDGLSIVVDPGGGVSSPPWAFQSGTRLNIQWKPGNGTETAWPELVNDFDTWTPDHRVRGIAQILLRATNPGTAHEKFPTLFQGGVKTVQIDARVQAPYDPRTGTDAWTLNGVLNTLHWMRRLPGVTDAIIDFDDLEAVADEADEQVPTLTSTAPRCRLSGGWKGPLKHDIVEDMLESAGLEAVRTETGKWTFHFIEDWPEPDITFRAKHIIDIFPQSGPDGAKRPNICKLRYFSPERGYEVADVDLSDAPWAKVQDEIDVYGEQEFPVDLIFCMDCSQAQRIARRLFYMARADFGTLKTHFAGLAAWGKRKRTALIEIPDVGEDGESVFVRARLGPVRANDDEGTCEIPFHIIPDELSTPWDPSTMEVPPPPQLPVLQYESNLDTPAMLGATIIQYSGGGYETRSQYTHVANGSTAEANYRTYSGGLPNQWAAMNEYEADVGGARFAWASVDTRGGRVDFRARWFDGDGNASYPSPELTIDPMAVDNSTPPAPFVGITEVSQGGGAKDVIWTLRSDTLRVVSMVLERLVEPPFDPPFWEVMATFNDIRPGTEHTHQEFMSDTADPIEWRASARTSNGTLSPYATGTVT